MIEDSADADGGCSRSSMPLTPTGQEACVVDDVRGQRCDRESSAAERVMNLALEEDREKGNYLRGVVGGGSRCSRQ